MTTSTKQTKLQALKAQWLKETSTLSFKAWYDAKVEATVDSWMTKKAA